VGGEMSEIVRIGDAMLIHGDCLDADIPECLSLDVVVTSPPYAQQRQYGGNLRDWDDMMDGLLTLPECQILVNLGQIHKDGEILLYWEAWQTK